MGADCKSAGLAFSGSNPLPTTLLLNVEELQEGLPVNNFASTINTFLKSFNLELRKISSTPLRELFTRLKKSSIELHVIWDVGAYKGEWTRTVSQFCPESKFILFEPNLIHNNFLEVQGYDYYNLVLGNANKTVKFYSHGGTGDSIYPEFDEKLEKRKNYRLVEMVKLDTLVNQRAKFPVPDFLKLDVQGAELDVLSGAIKTLKDIKVILMECPIVHYNWGSPDTSEYLSFMFSHDYIPFFVTEIHRLQQIVTQVDIAFVSAKVFAEKISPLQNVGFWKSTTDKYLKNF